MFTFTNLLAVLGGLITILAYVLYVRDIFVYSTKPHAFSWLIWFVLGAIALAAQIVGNAGAGALILAVDITGCLLIFVLALYRGERHYVLFDWIALVAAGFSLFLWWLTKTPTLSVILVAFTDIVGYTPTFRKSFHKPHEETASMYVISALKFVFALLAMNTYSIATSFYPAVMIAVNTCFTTVLFVRRRQLK